ncbi:MAG: putative membrane protein [Rhodothermales bacterium]|jgi:uncharacterized membrane protein
MNNFTYALGWALVYGLCSGVPAGWSLSGTIRGGAISAGSPVTVYNGKSEPVSASAVAPMSGYWIFSARDQLALLP